MFPSFQASTKTAGNAGSIAASVTASWHQVFKGLCWITRQSDSLSLGVSKEASQPPDLAPNLALLSKGLQLLKLGM